MTLPANIRPGWKGLPGTNTCLLRKSVNYGRNKFYSAGPVGGLDFGWGRLFKTLWARHLAAGAKTFNIMTFSIMDFIATLGISIECHYAECHIFLELRRVLLCWVSSCWVSSCWVSSCWVSSCWVSSCWVSHFLTVKLSVYCAGCHIFLLLCWVTHFKMIRHAECRIFLF